MAITIWYLFLSLLFLCISSTVRKRPHDADEIWKDSFAFTFKPTVHVVRYEKGAFRKHSSHRRNFKTPAFRFKVDGKHCKTMTPLNFLTLDGSKLIKCSLLTWRSFLNQSRSFTASLGCDDKIFERRRLIVHLSNLIRRYAWLGGNLNSPLQKREGTGASFLYWLDWISKP